MKEHFSDKWPEWKKKWMDELGLDEDQFNHVIDSSVDMIAEKMSNPTMPGVVIPRFGKIYPNKSYINSSIWMSILHWKKGRKTRESLVELIKRLWPIRNRLINEKDGEYTAKNWNQYYKASEGEEYVKFVENKYTGPREKIRSYRKILEELNKNNK